MILGYINKIDFNYVTSAYFYSSLGYRLNRSGNVRACFDQDTLQGAGLILPGTRHEKGKTLRALQMSDRKR